MFFKSLLWQIEISPPWRAVDVEHCIEIIQPEGTGALHISAAQKQDGFVSDDDLLSALKDEIPLDTEIESSQLGEFKGYCSEYVNWTEKRYWKTWVVCCRKVLVFITYNCGYGDEGFEAEQVLVILKSLRCKE